MAKQDNSTAIVFGKMKEDINGIKGDVSNLKVRVGAIEEQPSGGKSSSPTIDSGSLYSAVCKAMKDVLTERENMRKQAREKDKEKCSFSDLILQREDEWLKRATNIGEEYKKALKREENIDNRLTNIEASIKTDKQTDNISSSKIEITPFQHVQLTFKSFFQKSFMLDPRVIILNTFLVFLLCAVASMSMKLSNLQDTKQKYEIMRNFYGKYKSINADFIFLDMLFLDKDKNEEVIEKMKK